MTATAERTSVKLHLPTGMVGFPEATDYTLSEIEQGVYEMLSTNDPEFGFVVIEPDTYFQDYNPSIDKNTAERLGLGTSDDALLLAVVNIGTEGEAPVANLLAPIVVNKSTREASQVVLSDQDWPLRGTIQLS